MFFLLRIELPDVPGSLGRVAAAIGAAGANIEAIEIVEHRSDGQAVDNVFLELPTGVTADSVVSAILALGDCGVLWISRYAAGANITRDLEAVEEMTRDAHHAADRLVDLLPETFMVDWSQRLRRDGDGFAVLHGTSAAPDEIPAGITWPSDFDGGSRFELPEPWQDVLVAGSPLGPEEMIVIARNGGPEILDSEIARLAHLTELARSISSRR